MGPGCKRPGLLLSGLFMATIYIMAKRNPELGPPGPKFTMREKVVSLKNTWSILSLFLLVIGGAVRGLVHPDRGSRGGGLRGLLDHPPEEKAHVGQPQGVPLPDDPHHRHGLHLRLFSDREPDPRTALQLDSRPRPEQVPGHGHNRLHLHGARLLHGGAGHNGPDHTRDLPPGDKFGV